MRELRALRLKGRASVEDVALVAGLELDEALAALEVAIGQGHAIEKDGSYRLTPEGRDRLIVLLDEERAGVDQAALAPLYERFTALNGVLKELATGWQQRDGEPNDHSDAAYDQAILDRLGELDGELQELLPQIVALASRLEPYAGRFGSALDKIRAGDHSWFLRPITDSYHTVWFELHEDLIGLSGNSRQAEAAAGRAQ